MTFTNDEIKAKYLNTEFILCQSIGGLNKNTIFKVIDISEFICNFTNTSYEIYVKQLLNLNTGSLMMSNYDFKELLYASIPLTSNSNIEKPNRTIKESTVSKINTNSKFDKYKGKLIIEIKNNSIMLSNNILNVLQVSSSDTLAFYTSIDNTLFIAKSLEQEGIKPNKNKITGNDAKNIIEIFRNKFGDKNMYSIQLDITKDPDNPDYSFYEIIPVIDKTIIISDIPKTEELSTLLEF